MIKLTHKQISARIKAINKSLEKLDNDYAHSRISDREYRKRRRMIVLKKLFPLQKAGLVLANPHIYGYTKKSITLTHGTRLANKFGTGGTLMTPDQFYRFYGFKYTPRRKK
jgi:hypothetical protein